MQQKEYWIKRFDQLTEAQLNKGSEYYYNLQEQYRKAIDSIEKDIAKWYARYATENGISLTEAKRLLNGRELAEFRMDVKEYIEKGKSLDPKWAKQLEAASVKVHVSRLEALKIQMQQAAENVCGGQVDGLDKLAKDIYTDGYYKTAYEVQKGVGVGFDLMQLDTNKIDKLISKPWAADGKNFSARVWENRAALVSDLENTLTQSIIRGQSPKKVIADIAQRFNVSKNKAGRLIMTESAFFAAAAQKDCFSDLGVEKYEIVATLDSRTSETCRHLDGKVIPMADYKPGVTAPPFHVYCRSTTVPYFDDEFTAGEQRAARDENGKYYTVPANMKYPEWKEKFVDGGSKENLQPANLAPKTLAERLADIRVNLDDSRKSLKVKQVTIKTLEAKSADVSKQNTDIDLQIGKIDAEIQRYNFAKTQNYDSEIAAKLQRQKELQAEKEKLDAISDRYYNGKPDRTINRDKWAEWREWRHTVDIGNVFDKQVSIDATLRDLQQELKSLEDMQQLKQNFDIAAANKELAELKKKFKSNNTFLQDTADKVAELKKDIAALPAEIEKQVKAAGKEVIAEINNNTAFAERGKKIADLQKRNSDLAAEYNKASTFERGEIYKKWKTVYNELQETINKSYPENAQEVKALLSQVREMGSKDVDVLKHLNNSKSKQVQTVLNAYDMYPTDWVRKSAQRNTLSVKAVKRGYYSDYKQIIAISGDGKGSSFRTAIHELGHRFEKAVPQIREAEKAFYERRTAGESLRWLGGNYGKNERSRFDKFISRYMGKDYSGDAYELVSMGFELGYTDPAALLADADMAEWIYGLLSVY